MKFIDMDIDGIKRINRYIMECKSAFKGLKSTAGGLN